MIEIALHRTPSRRVACFDVRQLGQGDISRGWRDKSADCRRAFVAVREGDLRSPTKSPAGAFAKMSGKSISPEPSLIPGISRPL